MRVLLSLVALLGCSSEETLGPPGSASASPPADGGAAPTGPASPATGQTAVGTRKCTDCHGANMAGSAAKLGGQPAGIDLYAPNLTPDPETGIGSWTDSQLRYAIREGIDKDGLKLCPQMQHYLTMPEDEVAAIISYLRSLPPVKNAVRESVCPPLKR